MISKRRVSWVIFSVLSGVTVSALGRDFIHNNDQAINVITTVFSILAGFLVAIFAILGDPGLLLPGSSRLAALQGKVIHKQMRRYEILFYVYLGTLGLILASMLIKKDFPLCNVIIEHIYLGLAICGFMLSLGLPSTIMSIHSDRVKAEVDSRRKPEVD